jgi:hypothetical protein
LLCRCKVATYRLFERFGAALSFRALLFQSQRGDVGARLTQRSQFAANGQPDRIVEGSPPLGTLKQFSVPSHGQAAVGEANGHSFPFGALNNFPGLTLQIHLVLPKRRFGSDSYPIAHSGPVSVCGFLFFICSTVADQISCDAWQPFSNVSATP